MFKQSLIAVATVAAMLSSAQAEMKYSRSGDWQIAMGLNDGGVPMCAVGIGGGDKSFWLKAQSGDNVLFVHIGKAGWQIPVGQRINISVQVDNAPLMWLAGVGIDGKGTYPAGWSVFQVAIGTTDVWSVTNKPMISELVDLLANGRKMRINFLDGNEVPWVGPLNGSAQALNTMVSCVDLVAQVPRPAAPTQPFTAAPTQPFSASPTTTQPFGKQL
jgi:hypothetical protein